MPSQLKTDQPVQNDIAFKFDHMPLQSWGLSSRTLNALLHHNFKMTVGDVIRAHGSLATIKGLGDAGITELNIKVAQVLTENQGNIRHQLAIDQSTILSETPINLLPKVLPQSVHTLPLDQLHLDLKTHNALVKAGITTIGELYNADKERLEDIQGLHPNSLGNVNGSLITLLNSMVHEYEVNWFQYWRARGIQVLPLTGTSSTTQEQIIKELPKIIEEVLRRERDERAWIIIQRRFGLGNAAKLTLEDMGNAFGITRERIRQLEERALKTLQDRLIEQHYAGKDYHVHPAIHLMIQTIRDIIEAEPSKLILETQLFERIGQTLNINTRKVKSSLLLILPLMSIERIEFDYPNSIPVWGYVESAYQSILENGIKRLDDLLTRDTPLPQTEFDILVHLNKKAKKSEKITLTQLAWLIDLCNSVERREDGSIGGKFEYLKGRGNQVERLLFESGVPMRIADLAREINHRLVPLGQRRIVEQNLTNQIIGDDRFVAIGHSGKWGLKSWSHIDTKSILALMEEYLITHNKPATVDDIFTYVSERRPVSRQSVIMYLINEKDIFVKTGRTTWGLAKWSDGTEADTWNTEQVADFVANIFKSNKTKELSYKMLKETLMQEVGINAKQAQGLLNANPVIKTRSKEAWGERIAVFQPNYKALLAQAKLNMPHQRVSLRKQIEEAAFNTLNAAPDKQMSLTQLIHQLHQQLECSAATAYNYLRAMDSLEWIDVPNSRTKICRLRVIQSSASSGTLRQRISESVRDILENAPNKQVPLSELLVLLRKEYDCPKSTLYSYIASLDYLERLDIHNSLGKICRIKDISRSDLFPQVQNIIDATLREKVGRTLPFLTKENVDIGLFLLSKEFEATLKTYLLKASAKGKLGTLPPGKGPDKWNLIGMVECAKDNGIITDHATFHYLRQARNDRAHGTMPSLAERQLLMKHVQYIAGLYIDYIKILDDLSHSL